MREKIMTIEELMGEFVRDHEDQIKQFAPTNTNAKKKNKYKVNSNLGPNQGISQSLDKTFSRIELEKSMSKTQSVIKKAKNLIINTVQKDKVENIESVINKIDKQSQVTFERKLKQAIIDRLDDKNKFLNSCDINDLVGCIRETKMSVENEREDLQEIMKAMDELNSSSKVEANKIDKRISFIQNRLHKIKALNQEQE